jgi:hypothetical protein
LPRLLRRGPRRGEVIQGAAVKAGIEENTLLDAADVLEVFTGLSWPSQPAHQRDWAAMGDVVPLLDAFEAAR